MKLWNKRWWCALCKVNQIINNSNDNDMLTIFEDIAAISQRVKDSNPRSRYTVRINKDQPQISLSLPVYPNTILSLSIRVSWIWNSFSIT